MADPSYQRSIDQAARTLAAANADWDRINTQMLQIPATDREVGSPGAASYKALSDQLDGATKRSGEAEKAYQSALELSDRASAAAKEFKPTGEPRQRLDTTAGNVLVVVTELADGRGGWTLDPNTPPTKANIPGVTSKDTIAAAPAGEFILKNGVIEKNPAYVKPTPNEGGAVPTSEYVYDADGKPVKNVAYVAPIKPKTPDELLTAGGKATDAVTAANAVATGAASLSALESAAELAAVNLATARSLANQRPTDQQAQQRIQQELDKAEREKAKADFDLEQARKNAPLDTERKQQEIDKTKQGDLYGRQDRIKQIRDLIASGEIKPGDADNMIQAELRGTDIYSVMKESAAEKSTQRGQDIQNKNSLAGNFASTFNSSLNTFQDMNKTGAIGSDATGKAFLATLGMAQDYLKSYQQEPGTPTDYLGTGSPVGAVANMAQQQLAVPVPAPVAAPPAPVAAAPAAPGVAAPVTINIGGAPAPSPDMGVGAAAGNLINAPAAAGAQAGLGAQSGNVGALVGAAAQATPATVAHVDEDHQAALARIESKYGGRTSGAQFG